MHAPALQHRTTGVATSLRALPLLGVLVALGACLRLVNLGALGFRWDEDLSSLAVQAILEHGIPLLPSGMIYPRGGAFLYMMAASAQWLGFSEFSVRLPAALFGIALIPLGYAFGKALFDARVGLIVAGLLTVSQWDIELSRYARMYAPFIFFYVLTLRCLWVHRVQNASLAGGLLCVGFAIAAVSLHQLGYTLVAAFFFPLILRGRQEWLKLRSWVYPVAAGGVVAAFFFFWAGLENRLMWRAVAAPGAEAPSPAAVEASAGMLAGMPLLDGLLAAAPLAAAALIAATLLLAAAVTARSSPPLLHRALLWLIAACCVLQLFNVALLALLALAFSKRTGLEAFRRPDVVGGMALIATAFVAWLALAKGFGLVPSSTAAGELKGAVRSLLDYPYFFVFWGYAREWPMASLVALIGGLWAFDRASRPAQSSSGGDAAACRFLLLALGTPLIANGLFATSYQIFRYDVPFNTLFFTFLALALVHWRDAAERLPGAARRFVPSPTVGVTALAVLALAFDLNPLRGWLVSQHDYVQGGLHRAFGFERHPDFKTPAEFIARNAAAEDLIIVLDSREYYNYLGRLDYWVRTSVYETQSYLRDGRLRDLYVDTPLIMNLEELQAVLREPKRTKWLAASDSMDRAVSDDIKQFILAQRRNVAYVGRDGSMKVYRFE